MLFSLLSCELVFTDKSLGWGGTVQLVRGGKVSITSSIQQLPSNLTGDNERDQMIWVWIHGAAVAGLLQEARIQTLSPSYECTTHSSPTSTSPNKQPLHCFKCSLHTKPCRGGITLCVLILWQCQQRAVPSTRLLAK